MHCDFVGRGYIQGTMGLCLVLRTTVTWVSIPMLVWKLGLCLLVSMMTCITEPQI